MMRSNWKATVWLVAGLMLAGGCGRFGGAADKPRVRGFGQGEARQEEAVPVEVVTLSRGPIEAMLRLSSNLEAERAVTVYAQAPRLVRRLLVEEGDAVTKGQLLVRLQDDEQRLALKKAESRYRQAKEEFERQQKLYEQQLVAEQVFIDAHHALDQARVAYDEARQALSYTEVRAPIAGIVTERLVNLGDSVTINQALFRVVDFDSIVARIYVPEKDLRRLAVGQPARIFATALGEKPLAGKVLRISPVVDPKTGTIKVTVAVPNQPGLRPGLFVDVELVTDVHPDAILIPKRALVYDNDQVFAFRVGKDHRAHRTEVKILLQTADTVEPAGGFDEGDILVVAGQAGLKDGTLVRLPGEPVPTPGASGPEAARKGSRRPSRGAAGRKRP
ncbi:MAG: efflux RND transporter periplasmic adaptor subunit [Acidobacteria bacterium]|nr:efflux RND transporter periplasmic adaptor subunit [Acidobacteriota bacterium]